MAFPRRLLRLLLAAWLAASLLLPGRADDVDVKALIAKHLAYVGWQLGDGTFKTLRLTREYTNADGKVIARTTEIREGLLYRATATNLRHSELTSDRGFTGNVFWQSNENGFTIPIYGDEAKYLLSYLALVNEGLTSLPVVSRGTAQVDGKQVAILRFTPAHAVPVDVAIDPATGAFVRATFDPDGAYDEDVHILSYREVQPGKRVIGSYRLGDDKGLTTYTDVVPNTAVEANELHPPPPSAVWNFANPKPFPISITQNRILVNATVNGVTGRFILDTGAAVVLLDERFADRAHVEKTGVSSMGRGLGGTISDRLRRVSTFEIGGNTLSNLLVYTYDFEGSDYRGLDGQGYDGIIGYDFLAGALVSITSSDSTMTIADPASAPPAPAGLALYVDLSQGIPAVPMTLNEDIAVNAFLDSGDPNTVLYGPDLVSKYHLRSLRRAGYIAGVGGIEAVECGPLSSLKLGPIIYQGLNGCQTSFFGHGSDIVVGLDFLKHFDLVLDYSHGEIGMKPLPNH